MSIGSLRSSQKSQKLLKGRLLSGLAVFFLVFCAILAPDLARAENFEVTPILGYTFGGDFEDSLSSQSLHLGEGESYGLILGMKDRTKAGGMYELLYQRQSTRIRSQGTRFSGDDILDVAIDYFHLGGTYGVKGEAINPYAAAGVGLTHMVPERGDAETRFSFSIGGGVKVPLSERVGLRFEGRGFATVFDGRGTIFCADNACEIRVAGDLMWQFTAFSGIVFSF